MASSGHRGAAAYAGSFLGLGLDEATPEHSTIPRTRRLIDLETHRAVFTWVLQVLAQADLVKGLTVGVDATTLEANAALHTILRRADVTGPSNPSSGNLGAVSIDDRATAGLEPRHWPCDASEVA